MDITVNVTNAGAANVAVSNGSTVNATVGNGGAVNVSLGTISPGNATVVSGTLTINSTTTLTAGSSAYAKNVGTAYAASLDLGIPAGPATLVSVGNTTTLAAGSNATVTGTTSGSNLTLAFGVPRGVTPAFAIGNVTTSAAGSSASVTATATNSGANVTLDLTIPRGDPGASGSNGANGTSITLSDGTPANLGTAAAGSSCLAARADHIHLLPSLTTLGAAASNHAHNYVTALNNLTGSLTLAAGSNVSLSVANSTLTISSVGGLGANDSIDGGDYVGQLVYGITFGTQPQSVNASSTTTVSLSSLSPSGTAPMSVSQITGGLTGAGVSAGAGYSNFAFTLVTSVNNGATWMTASSETISSSGLYITPTFSTSSATNGTRTVLGSYKLLRSDAPTANSPWTSTGYSWDNSSDGGYTVAFNGVRFVAVAKVTYSSQQPVGSRSLSVLSSSDGASWTARTLPLPVNTSIVITSCWKTVAAVNGVFVIGAVARQISGGNSTYIPYIWTSSDGVSWTQTAFGSSATNADPSGIPTIDVFSDLASSGTVAVGVKGTTARYTTDGTTWGTSTLPVSCNRISYAAGYFWAFATSSGTDVCYSINGTSWTLGTMPTSAQWQDMAGATNGFAVSTGGQYATATIGATYGSANLTVSASATSGSAVSYQWQSSVDAGTTWANVANATSTTLSLTGLTTANSGTRYRAGASATGATTAYSQSATLTVT